MMVSYFAHVGGIFALLVFWHFISDWIFQSHDEAMRKTQEWKVRAKHCLVYSCFFIPVLLLLNFKLTLMIISFLILFISHFIEDTYYPVFLWAKYIRKSPEFLKVGISTFNNENGSVKIGKYTDIDAFRAFVETPLGKILMIVIDQLIHITFLIPIAMMAFY